jgi:hypothetical protein
MTRTTNQLRHGRNNEAPASASRLDYDCFLDGPTIGYEAKDPASERRAIPLRLGKLDRGKLDAICETLGVTRTRFYRVLTRIVYREFLEASDSRLKDLLAEHFRLQRADRRRRKRFGKIKSS